MILPRSRLFWAVGLGHLMIDTFNSIGPVLLAFLSVSTMPISNTQLGLAASLYTLTASLSQPFFGWLGDKTGGRLLAAGGLLWTVSLLMVAVTIAQTGNYWLMLPPFALAALGSGAFHPVGAMHASESDKTRAATNTSYFFMMGQTGLAIGPALTGFLLDRAYTHAGTFTAALGPVLDGVLFERGSMTSIYAMGLIALPVVAMMVLHIPGVDKYSQMQAGNGTQTRLSDTLRAIPVKPFLLLALVVAMRSLANPGAVAFFPRLFQSKGWAASDYGLITSSFWFASGVAGVLCGFLADRFDRRHIIAASLILSAPTMYLLPLLDGTAAFVMALLAGALTGGIHSLIVLLAQSMMPGRKGFASGAILGFVFATGALGSLFIGSLSDSIGLAGAIQFTAVLTALSGLLELALPHEPKKPVTAPVPMPVASRTQ